MTTENSTERGGVSPCGTWLSVASAAESAGCSEGWLRLLLGKNSTEWLRDGRCWKVGTRAWAMHRDLVKEIKDGLSDRSLGLRDSKSRRKQG
jgi:hypothetical protein